MELKELRAKWMADIELLRSEIDLLKKEKESDTLSLKTFEEKNVECENQIKSLSEGIKAIELSLSQRKKDTNDDSVSRGGFTHMGEFFTAIGKTRVDREIDKRLFENNERMIKAPSSTNSQSASIGSEGGFLIPEYFANQLLESMNVYGKLLSRCFQLPVSGPMAIIPALCDYDHSSQTYYGGVAVTRGKERTQITGTSADFGQITMTMKKLVGMCGLTSELRKWSAISIEPILRRMFGTAMSATIERELIQGGGSGGMQGLLSAPAKIAITVETGQTTDDLRAENITKMIEIIPDDAVSPVWIYHPKMFTPLALLSQPVGLGGAPLNWFDMKGQTFLTYAAQKSEFCKAVNTEGDLIFSDLGSYVYAYEAGGENVAVSPHFWFDYDTDAIRFTLYNDGQCWWKSSRTLDDGSTKVSPVLTLATRT